MAAILWNQGEEAFINTVLNASAVTPAIPAGGGNWGLGMGAGGVAATTTKSYNNGTNAGSTIGEIGQTTAAGYARVALVRSTSGWPASSIVSGSHQTTAPQQTFTFTGSPNLNGATLWFVAKSTTLGAVDCIFGADLAATRTFANGDTEKITVTYRQT
jgi:hypothetical protein